MIIVILGCICFVLFVYSALITLIVFDRERKQKKEPEPELLDGDIMREISKANEGMYQFEYSSEQKKILKELVTIIKNSAEKGFTSVNLLKYRDLNYRIQNYFTRQQIIDYFEPKKYTVKFEMISKDTSYIEEISW